MKPMKIAIHRRHHGFTLVELLVSVTTIIILAALVFLTTGAGLLHAQNLVPNGGFENNFSGWSNGTSGGASASFALETVQPYSGAKAIRVNVASTGPNIWNVQTLGPTFTGLGTGRDTTITFRARAATPGTRVRMVMQTDSYQWRDFTLSTAWTYFVWNHTTAENSPRFRIHYRDVGTVWLDDISVVAHDAPPEGTQLISLNPGTRHQTMDGFGGALTWYAIRMINSPHRNTLEQLIFDDLGLDLIRLKNWYFPADYPDNTSPANIPTTNNFRNNYNMNKTFHDMAKANGRDIRILFSSWSPPAVLKSNNHLQNGGTLKKVNGQYVYAELAQYWVDLLDNMNWTPEYLSFQNEPGWVAAHESCEFAPTETATLAGYAEALDAIYDRLKDRPDMPVLVGPESESMQMYLTQAPPLRTRDYLGINAYHAYDINTVAKIDGATEIGRMNSIRQESVLTNRRNWMSELSRGEFDWLDTATIIHNTMVEANTSAYIYWKLVWGESTSNSEIMINIDGSGNYVVGPTYHAIKHFSKHISRGYQRFQVTGSNNNVRASGYINPAGNQATLVVINRGNAAPSISLRALGLPIASAVRYRTRQVDFDNNNNPFQFGAVNLANPQQLAPRSITTFVINLAETLNPYDPALLRVDESWHDGGHFFLTMPAQPGHDFILWKSTTLAPGSWEMVPNAVFTESDGKLIITDPNPDTPKAFYSIQRDTGL